MNVQGDGNVVSPVLVIKNSIQTDFAVAPGEGEYQIVE